MALVPEQKVGAYLQSFEVRSRDQRSDSAEADLPDLLSWFYEQIPRFDCPDSLIERTYYFRWWTYRQHVRRTPLGWIVTEFLPDVPWAGLYNSISCAAGHHFYEGRWIRGSQEFLGEYLRFWFQTGASLSAYSNWIVDAAWNYALVSGDFGSLVDLLPQMVAYDDQRRGCQHSSGLFWSADDRDGMEYSISGDGLRPTLNAYVWADARALSRIAWLAGESLTAESYSQKASALKALIQTRQWDERDQFFKTVPLASAALPVASWDFNQIERDRNVRELAGYVPWYFGLPDPGYEKAWAQVRDRRGFSAPYGLTTAEQRHHRFRYRVDTHECLWNGPSWPYATAMTLTALAKLLHEYHPQEVTREDYGDLLRQYARAHHRGFGEGSEELWIDENLDPFSGQWESRRILESWGWPEGKGGRERGRHYNHSTYCDLVITGLVGLDPQADSGRIIVDPLVPKAWEYFCLEGVAYRDRTITIQYDRNGRHYGRGSGLRVLVDGLEVACSERVERLEVSWL